MFALRIQNLRCLKDTGYLELKPLTLMVGRNSSGKSTFLRFLPLLQQSMNRPTRGPILWNGDLVTFGSFDEAVRQNGGDSWIGFGFKLASDLVFDLRMAYDHESETTYISQLDACYLDHRFKIDFDHENKITSFLVNQSDLSAYAKGKSDLLRIPFFDGIENRTYKIVCFQEALNEVAQPFTDLEDIPTGESHKSHEY